MYHTIVFTMYHPLQRLSIITCSCLVRYKTNLEWESQTISSSKKINRIRIIFQFFCSKIENIPYDLIFTTKFNDSWILVTDVTI